MSVATGRPSWAGFLARVLIVPGDQPGDRFVEAEGVTVSPSSCRPFIIPCELPGGSARARPHGQVELLQEPSVLSYVRASAWGSGAGPWVPGPVCWALTLPSSAPLGTGPHLSCLCQFPQC